MTRYNTGNPIGSNAMKDLSDNAQNLDVLVNSKTAFTQLDRLGVERKTWHGMEKQFNDALADIGYEFLGDYAAGITLTSYNQIIRDSSGEFWRVSGSTDLPYTLTGTGVDEGGALVGVGDATLRSELAGTNGSQLINLGSVKQQFSSTTDDSTSIKNTMYLARTTSVGSDTLLARRIADGPDSTGYAVHALDSGAGKDTVDGGGGAIGGATSRTTRADAIVGNRRGPGNGHGVIGSRLESGHGDGVRGFKAGSGGGSGVLGYITMDSQGHGVTGRHEGTISGAGVYGERLNGAGPGPGVLGYAKGGTSTDASIMGMKAASDSGPASLFDARGSGAAVKAFAAGSGGSMAIDSETFSDSTCPKSNTFLRKSSSGGTCVEIKTQSAGGARAVQEVAASIIVDPLSASTGTSSVVGALVSIGSKVSGATRSVGVDSNIKSTGSDRCYAVSGVAEGVGNVRNVGVYGNAVGGTTNWSGYFEGNVFHGGSLTPSDARLKEIHHEIDGGEALSNVLLGKLYKYDKFSEYESESGDIVRSKIYIGEVGPIAQELVEITPDHVTEVERGGFLAVSDRSELYQLKAAVKHLAELLKSNGIIS